MVRLMLVLAPVMCILSGIAVSSMLNTYMKQIDEVKAEKKKTKFEGNFFMRSEVNMILLKRLPMFRCLQRILPIIKCSIFDIVLMMFLFAVYLVELYKVVS